MFSLNYLYIEGFALTSLSERCCHLLVHLLADSLDHYTGTTDHFYLFERFFLKSESSFNGGSRIV